MPVLRTVLPRLCLRLPQHAVHAMRSLRMLQNRIGIDAAVYTWQHDHATRSYGGRQRPRYVAAGVPELHMLQGLHIRMCGTDVR